MENYILPPRRLGVNDSDGHIIEDSGGLKCV